MATGLGHHPDQERCARDGGHEQQNDNDPRPQPVRLAFFARRLRARRASADSEVLVRPVLGRGRFALVTTLPLRRTLALPFALLTSLFLVTTARTLGAEERPARTPPRVVVDGVELPGAENLVALVDGDWWLRSAPVSEALRTSLSFDPATSVVELRDPLEGVVRRYDGRSGELTQDAVVQIFLPAGLLEGGSREDLRLPLTVLGALCDLEVWVSPDADQISLTPRGDARRIGELGPRGWELREVRYRGAGFRYAAEERADLSLETNSHLGSGELATNLALQAESEDAPAVRTGRAAYTASGRRIEAGDVGTNGLDWQRVSGRGLDWTEERTGGRQRFSFSAVRQLAGTAAGGGAVGTPAFDPWSLALGYRVGARPGAPVGKSIGMGVSWIEGTSSPRTEQEPSGEARHRLLLAHELRIARTWGQLGLRSGSSLMESERSGWGLDFDGILAPSRSLQMQAAVREFDARFAPPSSPGTAGSARRSGGLIWSPRSRLDFRLSHAWQRAGTGFAPWDSLHANGTEDPGSSESGTVTGSGGIDGGAVISRSTSLSAGANFSTAWFRSLSVGATRIEVTPRSPQSALAISGRGQLSALGWFWNGRHPLDGGSPDPVSTGGVSAELPRIGQLQLVHTWTGAAPAGGSWLLSTQAFREGRLQLALGQSWARAGSKIDFRLLGRLRWLLRDTHTLDLSLQETGDELLLRIGVRGAFGFGRGAAPGPSIPRPATHHGHVSGRVYHDADLDGVFGPGDRPLRGVRLRLDRGRRTVVTDDRGSFHFPEVTVGPHQVAVDPGTIRADFSLVDPIRRELTTAAFEERVVDFRVGLNRTIEGRIWYDRNGNGRWDESEAPAADVHVVAGDRHDTLTYPDGSFRLGDLPPGRRAILIDDSSIDPDYAGPGSVEVLIPTDRDPDSLDIPLTFRADRLVRVRF